jgi:(1->4)-alpha-D-glucan 1-alpha-D-glucosylmutase
MEMKEETAPAPSSIPHRLPGKTSLQARIPRATYRVQFGKSFNFRQSQELVAYWDDLGISDLYASPFFKPCDVEGAGYDVCEHGAFNPAIGTPEDFEALSASLRERSMGFLLDVVPNHMGISSNNPWWMDVLENGPSSPYSCFFDIDLHPAKPELENKVLLPILEDQYGKVLEDGKFELRLEEGAFYIYYYEHRLPVAPRTYSQILGVPLEALVQTLGKENEHLQEFQSILTALNYLPSQTDLTAEKLEERMREKEVIKRRIAHLCQNSAAVKAAVDEAIRSFNGRSGDPRSFDLMDGLISAQAYRPAFWRVAADEINYRRFFDINHLAAIRMELSRVFADAHRMIFDLLGEGKITGLRIDHPDGLWNPTHYFHQLQKHYLLLRLRSGRDPGEPAPADLSSAPWEEEIETRLGELASRKEAAGWPLYVVAEKILGEGESLPGDWAVYGTTGYDFLNEVNGLFVDGANLRAMDRIYTQFAGAQIHFANLVNTWKKMIMLVSLASEVAALSHQLERISEKNRGYRDFTLNSLNFVLREIIAGLPVYRTYLTGPENIPERDMACIESAVEEAKRRNPRTAESIFDFVRDTLLLRNLQNFSPEDRQGLIQFVMKFQQITGPVMAKGLEDTAFYIYNRLVSLNEVGGHPEKFGVSPEDFHRRNQERHQDWPHTLLATSTHDTKRSEDVRARIDVLSEIPGEWRAAVSRWSRWNAPKKTLADGQPAPDRNDEYLLYQTLVGAWPVEGPGDPLAFSSEEFTGFRERIAAYMRKATLEAKVHTSWVNPNEAYDRAVKDFVRQSLDSRRKNRFLADLQAFQRRVAFFGRWNSLSQVLLKLACPGVPDFYQGTELWDLSLVDPDNRRPVDYPKRRAMLAGMKQRMDSSGRDLVSLAREFLETSWDGRIKLYLIWRTLQFRRRAPHLFSEGSYVPLEGRGEKKAHLLAFARTFGEDSIVVGVPRLVVGLQGGKEEPPLGEAAWKDTRLRVPEGWVGRRYGNLFTGEELAVQNGAEGAGVFLRDLFGNFPVALLERLDSSGKHFSLFTRPESRV